jgi:hypothetical protein
VTLFGIFLTPVFFYVIEGMAETRWLSWTSAWLAWRSVSWNERLYGGLRALRFFGPIWLVLVPLLGLLFRRRRPAAPTTLDAPNGVTRPTNGDGLPAPLKVVRVDADGAEAPIGNGYTPPDDRKDAPDDDPDAVLSK